MSLTAEQAVSDIRPLSSLFNNNLLSDAQIVKLFNDGASELYDYMVMRYEQYFTLVPYDFTIPSTGGNTVKIPVDVFLKDNTCELNPSTTSPQPVPRLGSWEDRLQTFYAAPYGPRYWIGGDTLFIFPPNAAAGNYRLWYTPKYQPIALFSPVPNDGTPATINGFAATINTISFTHGMWTTAYVGQQIQIQGASNPANNGVFTISAVNDFNTITVAATLTTETPTTATALVIPPGYVNQLSTIMDPWFLYGEVHASISIRSSRQQDTSDLTPKLAALLQRVEAATSNRSEEVAQSPLREVRPYRDGYLVGYP
jgi:hypothetical protein